MNTALALPKIETQPKATKSQLIEALVAREHELWKKQREIIDEKIKSLREELHDKAHEIMLKSDKDSFRFFTRSWSGAKHIEIEFFAKSPAISKLIKQIEEIDSEAPTWFDEARTKQRIKDKMAAPKKENPLLNNPDAKSALDAILVAINNKPIAIACQDAEVVTE